MIIPYHRGLVLAAVIMLSLSGGALAYGSSVEDLVGAFSIEKTIKLGSSGSCFGSPCQVDPDPLGQPLINPMADNQAPSIAGFDLEPGVLSPDSRSINFTLHALDDQSGLGGSTAYFKSPSGALAKVLFPPSNRTSGTLKDGVYASRLVLPKDAERGAWRLENLTLVDGEGNPRVLQREDMMRLGQPAEFLVA
ncbi:MAG TPA: hypothetical protein VLB04_11535 [Methanotrichaceae archaeon]|nr:hypothetical protein [Methanotrichaceae archaeon]